MNQARLLVISGARIAERHFLDDVGSLISLNGIRPRSLHQRQRHFDAAAYDRLRVLSTELHRIHGEGGRIALRIGAHVFDEPRLVKLMQGV
jgi:hypothetical protein